MPSALTIKKINSSTLQAMKHLLFQRNQTIPEYVEWKYGSQSPKGFRGLVAFDGDQEVGCFGSIPLKATTKAGEILDVGWFADWFVSPTYRGHGLGKELLNCLIRENGYFLGHPGPRYAVDICIDAGWDQLAFQAKYRWVFNNREYYRHRSKNWMNAVIKSMISIAELSYQQVNTHWVTTTHRKSLDQMELLRDDDLENWFLAQPCIPEVHRENGKWTGENLNVFYADQILPKTGEKYRKVMMINPISECSLNSLSQFITCCKKDKLDYVELLTGSPELELICKRLKAIKIPESPIVYTGFSDKLMIPNLQGVHRENWLFQAARG